MRTRTSSLPAIGGCGCSGLGCIIPLVINLLIGGLCCRYCLIHWLPALHAQFPATFNMPDLNMKLWPMPVLLGFFGGELFIPGAIITWLLIGLSNLTLADIFGAETVLVNIAKETSPGSIAQRVREWCGLSDRNVYIGRAANMVEIKTSSRRHKYLQLRAPHK